MKIWKKRIGWSAAFVCVCYWCLFTAWSDSYMVPYLLTALLGVWAWTKRDRSALPARRERIGARVCGAVLSLAVALANYSLFFGSGGSTFQKLHTCLKLVLVLAGGFLLFREIFLAVGAYVGRQTKPVSTMRVPGGKWILFGGWALLLVIYGIVFYTSMYPGNTSIDSSWQIEQIMTGVYSNHHPYYHTQLIRLCMMIGMKLSGGDMNCAVACYSLFSMALLSLCFAYVAYTAYQITRSKGLVFVTLAWYALMPFHIAYSVTMWKDVPFGAAVTFFVVAIYRYLAFGAEKKLWDAVVAAVAAVGICLLRSNGWMVFAATVVLFGILFGKKHWKFLLIFIAILGGTYILKHPVLEKLNVVQPDTIEALSIPTQQISRVIKVGNELTSEQRALLENVVDVSKIPEYYCHGISDPIKNLVRERGNQSYLIDHKGDFLKLYVQLGMKYPLSYLFGWVDQTMGYWNGGYDYWRWHLETQGNAYGIVRHTGSETVKHLVEEYFSFFETSPLLQAFLSIGLHSWLAFAGAYGAWVKRDRRALLVAAVPILVVLSLLAATPVYAEFRYAYSLFCSMPFLLTVCLTPREETGA